MDLLSSWLGSLVLLLALWELKPFDGYRSELKKNRKNILNFQITLSLIGKFGATASFAIVFVYTAEMFPTEIRSTAVGASSLCGRIGGILAPQIAMLSTVWDPLPLLVMGTGSFIGGILVFIFLPETLGKKLPDSMQEALNL